MRVMMVVQLGLAMMLRGWISAASPLISGTTSGTSGSCRKAEELSMTTQPHSAAMGAYLRDRSPPALKSAISTSLKESAVSSSTVSFLPQNSTCFPAERWEASNLREVRGKCLLSRHFIISTPTAPVAPAIATLGCAFVLMRPRVYPFPCKWQEKSILVQLHSIQTPGQAHLRVQFLTRVPRKAILTRSYR